MKKLLTVLIVIVMAALLAACGCGINPDNIPTKNQNTADTTAKGSLKNQIKDLAAGFIEDLMNEEYQDAYEKLSIAPNKLFTWQDFKEAVNKDKELSGIIGTKLKLKDSSVEGDNDTWNVTLKYAGEEITVKVVKKNDELRVLRKSLYVKNWQIKVPNGASVFVDGIDLEGIAKKDAGTETTIYTVPVIAEKEVTVLADYDMGFGGIERTGTPKEDETFDPLFVSDKMHPRKIVDGEGIDYQKLADALSRFLEQAYAEANAMTFQEFYDKYFIAGTEYSYSIQTLYDSATRKAQYTPAHISSGKIERWDITWDEPGVQLSNEGNLIIHLTFSWRFDGDSEDYSTNMTMLIVKVLNGQFKFVNVYPHLLDPWD